MVAVQSDNRATVGRNDRRQNVRFAHPLGKPEFGGKIDREKGGREKGKQENRNQNRAKLFPGIASGMFHNSSEGQLFGSLMNAGFAAIAIRHYSQTIRIRLRTEMMTWSLSSVILPFALSHAPVDRSKPVLIAAGRGVNGCIQNPYVIMFFSLNRIPLLPDRFYHKGGTFKNFPARL
jgi:hypothetical protein